MDTQQAIVEQIPHLRRYARALKRDAGLADDLVQDCLERALSRVHLFRAGTNIRTWLFTILHNLNANQVRRASRRRTRPAAWMRIAAAIALFVVGGATGWGLHGAGIGPSLGEPRFVRDAVGAHIVYAAAVRHPVEVGADQEAHLVGWLSKRLGSPLKAPKLDGLGYQLVGGRLLPDEGVAAAQFMYEDASGKRLTVYVRPAHEREDTAFRFVSDRGVSALYWVDAPLACALIAEMPREEMLPIAHAVYEGIVH